jgi:hypothetical protein
MFMRASPKPDRQRSISAGSFLLAVLTILIIVKALERRMS